jgi:hypothetical protein
LDLNQLLFRHQRALIDSDAGAISPQGRRWAGLSADYYAERISEARSALGREDPFTWSRDDGGLVPCG